MAQTGSWRPRSEAPASRGGDTPVHRLPGLGEDSWGDSLCRKRTSAFAPP